MTCLCYDEGYDEGFRDGKIEAEIPEVVDAIADLLKSPSDSHKLIEEIDALGWILEPKKR